MVNEERIRIWSVSHIPLTDSFTERGFSRIEKTIHPRPSAALIHAYFMNELSDSPHSLHLSAGISGGRASDDPSRVAGGQLLRSDLAAVHATLAISRCAGRGRAAIVKMERGARRGGRQTDRETRHGLPAAAASPANADSEEQ